MASQFSTTLRDNILNQYESTIGASPILELRSGAPPANCAAADSGTLLASMTLPSDWMNAASSGTKTKLGTWQDASANAAGTIGHFRMKDSSGTTCHHQGTVTATGGGGDMEVDNVVVAVAQVVTVTTFTWTAPHA